MEIRPVYRKYGVGAADVSGEFQQPAMPLGLGMALAQSTDALTVFGALDVEQKTEIINYIQASTTGEEAKARIEKVVAMAREHTLGHQSFF